MARNPILYTLALAVFSIVFFFARQEDAVVVIAPVPSSQASETALSAPDLDSSPGTMPRPDNGEEPPRPGRGSVGYTKAAADYAGIAEKRHPTFANTSGPPEISYRGDGGPKKRRGKIIRTRRQWNALWKSVGGHDIPALDTANKMGVVMFGGENPAGTRLAIVSTQAGAKSFLVKYRLFSPEERAPGKARPYHVIVVEKSMLPPRFERVH